MSKFKPGDQVRHVNGHSTATVLAIHDGHYWMQYDDAREPSTLSIAYIDHRHELIPESFLPDGKDRYHTIYADKSAGVSRSTLAQAENTTLPHPCLGIIRIDGQTGALSWVKGGPEGQP